MEKLYYCFNKLMCVYVVEMRTWEKQKGTKEYWESYYGEYGYAFELREVVSKTNELLTMMKEVMNEIETLGVGSVHQWESPDWQIRIIEKEINQ